MSSLSPVNPAKYWSRPLEPGKAIYPWTDLTYLMHKDGVSWRYYVHEGIEPDCEDDEATSCTKVNQNAKTPGIWNPLADFTDVKEDEQLANIQPLPNFYQAAAQTQSCGLPNVSWIVPDLKVSEHPPERISYGQAYVTTLINTIMRSPCWGSTAVFLSWDDWGGYYDHVPPPEVNSNGYGLRVPGIVISPYAKAGFIDHQQLSHDAYLKFIENDFLDGSRLNPATDGRPDSRPDVREEAPGLGDLVNDFDFEQTPRQPLLLPSRPSPGPASVPPGGQQPPALQTAVLSSLAQTSATLNATVDPDGATVSDCHFDYGPTASYGTSVSCASLPGSGSSPVAVSALATGLSADTSYHFRIVATNAGGTSYGPDLLFTTPLNAPTVTAVQPDACLAQGGTMVTITGTNFTDVVAVKFGTLQASDVTVTSPSSISVLSPPGTGAVNVTVTNTAGTSSTSLADRFTYVPAGKPPTITRLAPVEGSSAGGTSVTVTGKGFTGVTAVVFGSVPANSYSVSSETTLVAVSPGEPAGTVNVQVATPNGTSATSLHDHFSFLPGLSGLKALEFSPR